MGTIAASENVFPILRMAEGAAPGTPPTGEVHLYALADGTLAWKDDAGTVYPIAAGTVPTDLADLADVDGTAPDDGDVLTWDDGGGLWVPAAPTGGGGGAPVGLIQADVIPASPGAGDEEFEGTADTLPTDYAWVGTTPTFSLNSTYPSLLVMERAASTSTEYKLRISNFTAAATCGVWVKMSLGLGQAGFSNQFEWLVFDSTSANGVGGGIHNGNTAAARKMVSSSLSNEGTTTLTMGQWLYIGVTRASNTWQPWMSVNGITWLLMHTGIPLTFTADRLEFRWSSDSMAGMSRATVDWIRYRTDNLFPRP